MSRFAYLSRVGRRGLGAMLLLASLAVAASGGASLGAAAPAASIPAGVTQRLGDIVPDETIRAMWDRWSPAARESLRQRKGIASLGDLRDMPITGPYMAPSFEPGPEPSDAVEDVPVLTPGQLPSNAVTQEIIRGANASTGTVNSGDAKVLMAWNPCTAKAVKANKVHYSQTDWC